MTKGKSQDERAPAGSSDTPPRQSAPALRSRKRTRQVSEEHSSPPHARNALVPTPERVLATALHLARTSTVEQTEESLVHAFVEKLRELFQERSIAVRLTDPQTYALRLVQAAGRLRPSARGALTISREAVHRHALDEHQLSLAGIVVTRSYEPLFEEGAQGFDVPLLDGERLLGVLSVEYPPDLVPPAEDPARVGPIALLLGSTLRNAQLYREAHYLRDYLEKLLESANAPIVVIDKHRKIAVVNRAFLAITGFAREDVLTKDFLKMMPEESRRRLLPVFIGALRGEPSSNVDVAVPKKEGGAARMSVNVASVLGTDGEVDAVIAIGRDLTEVHELEGQVIQAEKLATLGQLAAGVVHELNNPLTSISVYAEFLLKKAQKTGGDPSDVEKLSRIGESAARILAFTRDLVAYARPSAEQPRPVSLTEVVDQAVVFCDYLIQERGVAVERRFAPGLTPVYAVRSQLHQVFINLITNACHAMAEGQGKLVLTVESAGDGRVVARIADNGSGISKEHLEKIFDPFWTTKGEGKGTGLGLSIAKNIIQQHRGEIRVESEKTKGTTFTLVLVGNPPG